MFCTQCGTQLPDGAKFCSNCGAHLDAAAAPSATAAQPGPEAILMQGAGQVMKSAVLANTGSFVLTNQRLIFSKGGNIVMGKVLTEGKFAFEVPLNEIVQVERSKKGLVSTIRLVKRDGSDLPLCFLKAEPWLVSPQSAVAAANP